MMMYPYFLSLFQIDSNFFSTRLYSLLVGFTIITFGAFGQPAAVDLSFETGTGPDNDLSGIALQADGKILITGGFMNSVDGNPANGLARLNADGSFDNTFNIGSGPTQLVMSIAVQQDGKIIIGGNFFLYDGVEVYNIARINPDGSLDEPFSSSTVVDGPVLSIAIQDDGKILVGGEFTSVNGTNVENLARLNPDGSIDNTFNTASAANDPVKAIKTQPDGKVLIGGTFSSYNDNNSLVEKIARLNDDATLDESFITGTGPSSGITDIIVQPDGKILVIGNFTIINGASASKIARFNADGSLDTNFNSGTGVNTGAFSIALQSDGKIIIGGSFTSYNGTPVNRIARLNADGTLDNSFDTSVGADDDVNAIVVQSDGKIIIAGDFTSVNNTPVNYIARLNGGGPVKVVEQYNEIEPLVYPNPFLENVVINTSTLFIDGNYQFEVIDVAGKTQTPIVKQKSKQQLVLDFCNLTSGIYVLRLTDGKCSYSARIVKQ